MYLQYKNHSRAEQNVGTGNSFECGKGLLADCNGSLADQNIGTGASFEHSKGLLGDCKSG